MDCSQGSLKGSQSPLDAIAGAPKHIPAPPADTPKHHLALSKHPLARSFSTPKHHLALVWRSKTHRGAATPPTWGRVALPEPGFPRPSRRRSRVASEGPPAPGRKPGQPGPGRVRQTGDRSRPQAAGHEPAVCDGRPAPPSLAICRLCSCAIVHPFRPAGANPF